MFAISVTPIILVAFLNLSLLLVKHAQAVSICEALRQSRGNRTAQIDTSLKLHGIRAFCDAIHASQMVPEFDFTQIGSEGEANQILKRFRRGRGGGGGGGGRGGGGGGRGGGGGSRGGGGRFSGGSRSSSSRSGGSRIFSSSRSSSSSRVFSGSSSSSSSSRGGIFSRTGTFGGGGTRVRAGIRSMLRRSSSSSSSSGSKPSLSSRIRQVTHGSGGSSFGSGKNRFAIGGSGGSIWARSSKTFLPHAARFGKRYYQRRKYNQGVYTGVGYYAGSRPIHHGYYYYPHHNYGYPPVSNSTPDMVNGQVPNVFYCIQEDLNTTLVNKTLDKDGFGVCNVSGKLVTCPIEIECKIAEADTCCEDEQGTPFCCGGPIPEEYITQYGGYADDWRDSAESLDKMLQFVTIVMALLTTICFTKWQQRDA